MEQAPSRQSPQTSIMTDSSSAKQLKQTSDSLIDVSWVLNYALYSDTISPRNMLIRTLQTFANKLDVWTTTGLATTDLAHMTWVFLGLFDGPLTSSESTLDDGLLDLSLIRSHMESKEFNRLAEIIWSFKVFDCLSIFILGSDLRSTPSAPKILCSPTALKTLTAIEKIQGVRLTSYHDR